MLNVRISKAQFDALSDAEKAHYIQKGEQFVLDVNGDTDEMLSLRQQNVKLNQDVLNANMKAQQADAKVATANAEAEAKYKSDLEAAQKQVTTLRDSALTARRSAIVDTIAKQFTNPELFAPAIQSRVNLEYNDKGELVETFVNDKGESITLEQLTDSYCKNPAYSAMLAKPPSSNTMPTNAPNTNTQQPIFGGQNGGQNGGAAKPLWGYDEKTKAPVVYDYAALSKDDAAYKSFADAKVAYVNGTPT